VAVGLQAGEAGLGPGGGGGLHPVGILPAHQGARLHQVAILGDQCVGAQRRGEEQAQAVILGAVLKAQARVDPGRVVAQGQAQGGRAVHSILAAGGAVGRQSCRQAQCEVGLEYALQRRDP